MSGAEFVTNSAPPQMMRAMPQGQVTCSYLPLTSHAGINSVFTAETPRNRAKHDNTVMRHEPGDILFMYDRFGDQYEPHETQKQVRAFASHAGADFELFKHTRVVGIAEGQFIPGNTPSENLLSMSIRRVASLRLNGQRQNQPLVVDYGTSLIATMPTYEEVASNAFLILPETPRSTFAVRDLPILEPLQKYNNQSIDLDCVFDRAAKNALLGLTQTRTNLVQMNSRTEHENEAVWDKIDNDLVNNIRQSFIDDKETTIEFRRVLNGTCPDGFGSDDFFRIYAQQLHKQLAMCSTSEDYLMAQHRTVLMQIMFNWELMQKDSRKSDRHWSRVIASMKMLQLSVESIMTLGQENIAEKCKRLVGMSMQHGRYQDVIDVWFDPSIRN